MRRLVIDGAPVPEALRLAADSLRSGAVVAYPTDTLYGLGADPRNARAVDRVFAIKGRPDDKPLPLIAADPASASAAGRMTPLAMRLAARFWPGPLTLVVLADPSIVEGVHRGTGRVGIRVPDHAVARELAREAGGVLTATSANRSGAPATSDPDVVAGLAADGLDVLLDAGFAPGGPPSTIIGVTGEAPVLLRAGAVPWDRVLEFLREPPAT